MRKKIGTLAAACALAACVGLFGCSSGGSEAPSGEKADDAAQAAQKEPEQKESKYAVSIDECTVVQDYAGKAAIVVTYTLTNNAEKAVPFFTAVSAKAFQNGVRERHRFPELHERDQAGRHHHRPAGLPA